jgi:histidinol-phosphatase (PHP family)
MCHHAEGDLEDYIIEAIKKGLKVICFTEHAPLDFDKDKRLSENEVQDYIKDINKFKKKYANKINILIGLEIDYLEDYEEKINKIIGETDADFYLGSIHFIPYCGDIYSVWDYEIILSNEELQNEYFRLMIKAINSKLFDSISHPDLIFRAGFDDNKFIDKFKEIISELKKN